MRGDELSLTAFSPIAEGRQGFFYLMNPQRSENGQ